MSDIILAPIPPIAIAPEILGRCAALAVRAKEITEVSTIEHQAKAGEVRREIKREMKLIEQQRVELKAPLLERGRQIDQVVKDTCKPLEALVDAIDAKVKKFFLAEEAKARAEKERIRLEQERLAKEAAELAAQAQKAAQDASEPDSDTAAIVLDEQAKEKLAELSASVSAPPPAAHRAQGMVVRKTVEYEITDPVKVYQKWPHFFELKEKKSVIKGTITKDFVCEGMRVWEAVDTGWRG